MDRSYQKQTHFPAFGRKNEQRVGSIFTVKAANLELSRIIHVSRQKLERALEASGARARASLTQKSRLKKKSRYLMQLFTAMSASASGSSLCLLHTGVHGTCGRASCSHAHRLPVPAHPSCLVIGSARPPPNTYGLNFVPLRWKSFVLGRSHRAGDGRTSRGERV